MIETDRLILRPFREGDAIYKNTLQYAILKKERDTVEKQEEIIWDS